MWEKTYEVLKEYAKEFKRVLVESYIRDDRKATEDLINSVRNNSVEFMVVKDDQEIEVRINLEEYWKYVENDMPPRWPPLDADGKSVLESWIEAKPILPRPDKYGKLPTPKQLAFLIGRAMAGKSPNQSILKNPNGGTKGTHNFRDSAEKVTEMFNERLNQAVSQDVISMLDTTFTEYFKDL
jgi:hypothetical protein